MHTATRSLKNEKWNSSHSSEPARLCLQYWVQFWFPQFKGRIRLERAQRKVTKMFKGLLNLSHEEILKALGSFSLGKRRLNGRTHHSCPVLKEGEGSLFRRSHTEDKKQHIQVALGEVASQERNFFTTRAKSHCDNIPSDVAEFLSLDIFKIWLDRLPDILI